MKVGFLGAGAMGGALINGAIAANVLTPGDIYVADHSDVIKKKYETMGCHVCQENSELKNADIILLALKPQYAADGIKSIENILTGKGVISIMAGLNTETLRKMMSEDVRLLRLMPNTPALVNAGAFALDSNTNLNNEEKEFAEKLFSALGIVEWMPEKLIDVATGLSGAGPAYVYMFIEALADGGVLEGLPRATALRLAAQTVYGAAKMVLETGEHPDVLKDRVCSPGGNTIVGVKTLEEHGFRGACIDTVSEATKKARELGKQ